MRVVLVIVGLAALVATEPWQEPWEEAHEEAFAEEEDEFISGEPLARVRREAYEEEPYDYVRVKQRSCCDEEPLYRRARREPRQVHQYEVHEDTDDAHSAYPASPSYEEMLAASAEHHHRVASAPGAPRSAHYMDPDVSPESRSAVTSFTQFAQVPTSRRLAHQGQTHQPFQFPPVQMLQKEAQAASLVLQNLAPPRNIPVGPVEQKQYLANDQLLLTPHRSKPVPLLFPVGARPANFVSVSQNSAPASYPSPLNVNPNAASVNTVFAETDNPPVNTASSQTVKAPVVVQAFAPVNVRSKAPVGASERPVEDLAGAGAGHAHAHAHHRHHKQGHHAARGRHKHNGHHNAHGGRSVKGSSSHQHTDKGSKGHKTDEHHRKEHEEASGGKKKHHDHAEHKGGHEEEAHGHRGAHFDEKKGHKKGHKTKGYHNKYHKDEFHKEHKFYDDFHKSGEHHRYGKFHAKHASDESGKKKAHHVNAGHDFVERGKKGYSNKGHLDADHKGHKGKHGHEEHREHHQSHGKKGGGEGGKEWAYSKKN